MKRIWIAAAGPLVFALLAIRSLLAQDFFIDDRDDLPPVYTTQDESEDERPAIPALPETVVPGVVGDFPIQPLTGQQVITPSRFTQSRSSTASAITVITEDDIIQTRQSSVAEVLRGTPGLDVARAGGIGGQTSVFMRGASSSSTKVLIDGIPVNDPSGPGRAFDFGNLLVDNLERIEVLRGPQSMVYGSDAIGGVINIITKRGEGPCQWYLNGMAGTMATAQQALNAAGGNDQYYYSVGGLFLHSDSISAADSGRGNTERDRYQNTTISGRFGWTPSEAINIDYVFRYIDSDLEIDSFQSVPPFEFVDDVLRHNLTDAFYQRVQLESFLLDGAVQQKMGFNLTSYDRRDTNPGLFDTPDFDGQARLVDYVANILLAECNIFSVGVDYLQEEATSTFAPLVGQYNSGVWVQDEVRLADRWFATAGFRWDDHSSAGQAETYRFTNLIRLKETGTDVHSTIATGFRAPALAESKVTFGFGANPDLRPEQVRGIDVGATQTFCGGKFVLDGTYYRNRFRNLIQFDFPTFRLENIGSARASGVEVTGTWIMECCTTISAGYTLTDTINLETGEELARRPRHKANLVLSHDLLAGNGRVNLYFYYVGDRLDFAGGPTLEDYVLVNLSSSLRLTPCCELFVRMDNVLDQDYHEAGGFGTPGINGFGGVNLVW